MRRTEHVVGMGKRELDTAFFYGESGGRGEEHFEDLKED